MSKKQGSARPKQLRAIQTSRHLHMSHHRHTGRVLPRHTTSYPLLAMIVLVVGVLLVSWTRVVTAGVYPDPGEGSYTVSTSVAGPAPTQAPTITDPHDGQKFNTRPIIVSGECQLNTYQKLFRNGVMSGVALCSATGTYSLQTGLSLGNNQLQVQTFSLGDVPGPQSAVVNVLYNPRYTNTEVTNSAKAPSKPAGQASVPAQIPAQPGLEPLLLKTAYDYRGIYTGQPSSWRVEVSGARAPYAISVDWGDNSTSLISQPASGIVRLEHTYQKSGGYKGSYVITISATDAVGEQTTLQLLAIVNDPPTTGAATTGSPDDGSGFATPAYLEGLLRYAWPGYGIVVLMLCSFWLGERRELRLLKSRPKRLRHA